MARVLLVPVLAAALLLPAAAHASGSRATYAPGSVAGGGHRPAAARAATLAKLTARDPVALATMVAERYWRRGVPCGGQIAVRAEQPLAAGLDSTTDGWATFESLLGPNDLDAPASTYTHCAISLARWQWPTRLEMVADWNMFCLTVIHEMGHLLGHPHSLTPGSVMAPVFNDESSVPAICRAPRPRSEAAVALSRLVSKTTTGPSRDERASTP
jgi:hypothetical protein